MTRIYRKKKNNPNKLQQGFFSLKKYEKWFLKNSTNSEFLLHKLDISGWPHRFDGSEEIRMDHDGKELYLYDIGSNKLTRYRILENWIEWRDSDETLS
jgi:hypothetical protein